MIKKTLCLLIVISLLFTVGGISLAEEELVAQAESTSEVFSQALNDYEEGNYALAEEKLNSLYNNPELDEGLEFSVLYYLTMTAVNRYKTIEAQNYLQEMENSGYKSEKLYWKIGELYLNKDNQFDSANFNDALKYLKKAEKSGLDNLQFKRDLAYAYLETKQIDKSEKLYSEIIEAEATASDYLYLAKIKEKKDQLDKAVEYYESARDLNASQSSLYLNLANLYQKRNNYDSAISIYKQGLEMKNNFTPYYIGLGESYIKLKDYDKAESALNKAIEINENSYYGYYLLGSIEKEKTNYNKALDYFSKSLKYNDDYVQAYLAEGKIHLEREEYYKAISRFSLAVEKNPEFAESRYNLGLAYYNAEMLEASRSELRKALHISDSYPAARKLLDKVEKKLGINN